MNKTIVSLAAAAVAAGSVTGIVALDGSADAATTTHTLRIKVTGLDGGGQETQSGFVGASKVTTLKNDFLGYEVDSGSFGTSGITDRIAIALDGGILYARTRPTQTGENGRITGGAGRFAGAKGTIRSTSFDEEAQKATYTIRWHR
jgi:hypothetical protein